MTLSFCGKTVRKHDPNRFLLSLFAPSERREAVFSLLAFNHEISRTRDVVTDARLGMIRLQWWGETIKGLYAGKTPQGNPVLETLSSAIAAHDLPQAQFERLILARALDLEDKTPENMQALLHYADHTATPLMALLLAILGKTVEEEKMKNIAVAYALVEILRATPAHLRHRRCLLPEDALRDVGIAAEDLYAGKSLEALRPVVKTVANEAIKKLALIDKRDPFSALYAALARMYLKQIERTGYDIFSPRLDVPPFARAVRLWWAASRYTGYSGARRV